MERDLSTKGITPTQGTKGPHHTHAHTRLSVHQVQNLALAEEFIEPTLFFPQDMFKRFQKLEIKVGRRDQETESGDTSESGKSEKEKQKIAAVTKLDTASERFKRQNDELDKRLLLNLRANIQDTDSPEEILAKVLRSYHDPTLADDALDFLIETSDGELRENVITAKTILNERMGVEVRAGRNMTALARDYSTQELGSPTALRNMYRDLVTNPRDAPVLFEELSKEFPYDKMKSVIEFLFRSVGADLKSKGPSISRAELHNLMSETRNMQAILGIYRFFKSRMKLVSSAFDRQGLPMPNKLTFELIARMFMKFLQERYPSADKALMLAQELGISDSLLAEIIIYTQMRDGVRHIAPRLFKSEQHRQDVLSALIEALEELDKELEGEGEGEEEEEEQ